jgi:hypothetical protein
MGLACGDRDSILFLGKRTMRQKAVDMKVGPADVRSYSRKGLGGREVPGYEGILIGGKVLG